MAFDAFLKIEGIEGESTDKVHPGEIEIQSFSWGVSNTAQRRRRGRRRSGQGLVHGHELRLGLEQGRRRA